MPASEMVKKSPHMGWGGALMRQALFPSDARTVIKIRAGKRDLQIIMSCIFLIRSFTYASGDGR
jgi:hypothetical protein